MIWVRRAIALPLALVFIVLFIAFLVVCRVDATAGEPDFYIDQLRRADVYNFVYDEFLPAVLDEAAADAGNREPGVDIAAFKPYIIEISRQSLPPEWLRSQAENSISVFVPYILGDTEKFLVSLPLKDRVKEAARATKDVLHREDVFGSLYDAVVTQALDEATSGAAGLPEPFDLGRDELRTIVVTLMPEDWALAQIDGAIDEMTPYFTGDAEHFVLAVDIAERLDGLEAVAADILARPETYDYIIGNVIAPVALEGAGDITQSGTGVLLTDEEITGLLKETLPEEWYREQVGEITARIFAYLRGTQDTMSITIPIADRKEVAARAFGELVDRKLAATWDTLPSCSSSQLMELIADPLGHFPPECRPLGMSYAQLKRMVNVTELVAPLVDEFLPDDLVLTDAQLRRMLAGEGDEDLLSRGRELLQDGLTFTDADLRDEIGGDYRLLEDIRELVVAGVSFSDEDLREYVTAEGGEAEWQDFELVRASVSTSRSWLPFIWLLPLLLLAGIGALCGNNWRGRVIWAASVLGFAGAMAYVLFGPVFSALAKPAINEGISPALGAADGLEKLVAGKGIEIARNSIDSFVGGINIWAIVVVAVAAVAIVLSALWYRIFGGEPD